MVYYHTAHCTLRTAHCALRTAHCTIHNIIVVYTVMPSRYDIVSHSVCVHFNLLIPIPQILY